MEINREALAWAAGIFEGEGCWIIGQRNDGRWQSVTLGASVVNTDLEVLERFQQILGYGRIRQSKGPSVDQRNHKACYRWNTGGFERTQAFLALMWPWLTRRRKDRGKEVLRRYLEQSHTPQSNPANTYAMQLFGKRLRDLSPRERKLYINTRARERRKLARSSV